MHLCAFPTDPCFTFIQFSTDWHLGALLYILTLLLLAAEQLQWRRQAGRPESCSRAPWLWLCSDSCVWINYWIQISKVVACARWAFGGGGTTGKQQLTWPQPPSVHSEVPRLFLLQWHDGTPRSKVNTEKKVYASLIFPPHASRCDSPLLLSSSLVLFSLLLCMYLTFLKNAC